MCLLSSCPETEWNDDSRPWEPANKMEASGVREHSRGGNGGVGGSDPGEQSPELAQILTTKLSSLNLQMPGLSAVAMKGDEKLVDKFLSETVSMEGSDTRQSQLYMASFWGFPDVVKSLLDSSSEVDVNQQNNGTLWTPLHAATFQEHGKVVMLLLQANARADLEDSEGRTAKDFASASQKIWPHFAALGCSKTSKEDMIAKGIIRKVEQRTAVSEQASTEQKGIRMATFGRPGSAYVIQNPSGIRRRSHMDSQAIAACLSGDVLAAETSKDTRNPLLGIWKP